MPISLPIGMTHGAHWSGGGLARSHGIVFSSAAGGAHWQIAIRCPSLLFPSVKVHQAAVLVRRFRFSMVAGCVDQNIGGGGGGGFGVYLLQSRPASPRETFR